MFLAASSGNVLALALLQGFLGMGFQLVASRLLAPHFGTTLIVWAFLISTFLAAFSAGAFLGSVVSQFSKSTRKLAMMVQAAVGGACFAIVAFWSRPLLRIIEPSFEEVWAGVGVACALLFFMPIAALSGMLPILAQMLAERGSSTGVSSGLVYGFSTVGNIAGVMTTAFILIPNYSTPELLIGWLAVAVFCFGCTMVVMAE